MKERFSASVDAELLVAARQAVAEGLAPSLSAWVNTAMRNQVETDEKLRAIDDWIAEFEAEHGVITEEEMDEAERWAAERTIRWWEEPEDAPPASSPGSRRSAEQS